MPRFEAAALCAALAFGWLGVAAAATAAYQVGVPIDVVLTQPVSSETAQVGDAFYFKTAQEVKLGDVDLPAGTPGTGRLSEVVKAAEKQPGMLTLQADSLSDGAETIWVNIDNSVTPRGHYTNHRDLALDPGMKFRVISISPRKKDAPLVTPPPPNSPTSTSAMPSAGSSPAP